jgi:lysophospholipase L1-like esterase
MSDAHETVRRLSRRKKTLYAALSAGMSLVPSLFFVEGVARHRERVVAQPAGDPLASLGILRPNPNGTGSYRLKPNLDLRTRVQDYDVRIRTNSHGMRWRELPLEKRGGLQRIAFVGDSFTFGCWSSSEDNSFVGVFEQRLNPERFEALNFGVGGFGPVDIELQLREQVLAFAPDYVVIAMFNGNDFRDAYLGAERVRIVNGGAPFDPAVLERKIPAEFRESDFVRSTPADERSPLKRRLDDFATWRLLAPLLRQENLALEFRPSRRFTSYTFWSGHPYPQVAQQAVAATLQSLDRIHALLRKHGVRLAIAALPTQEQVYAERWSGKDFDISLPQAHLMQYARERGIPFLDLLPPLREDWAARNRRLYVNGDPHFNDTGHALVGRELAEWFRCCVRRSATAG